MNEIYLIYYGPLSEVRHHMLYLMGILDVREPINSERGFFVIEKRYGKEIIKKISLDPNEAGDILIYKFLSESEIEKLASQARNCYVLAHVFYDLEFLQNKLLKNSQANVYHIVERSNSTHVRKLDEVKSLVHGKNYFFIKSSGLKKEDAEIKRSNSVLPLFLLLVIKVIMNPINEVRRYIQILKFSKLRLISRSVELVLFINYLFKSFFNILVAIIRRLYYIGVFVLGLLRVLGIKLFFLIRHLLLMSGFKSFGVFVDTYNFLARCKDKFLDIFVYKLLHFLYYKVIYFLYFSIVKKTAEFIYYRLLHFIYYKIIHFIYYRVIYFLYYSVIKVSFEFIFYYILMPGYYRVRSFLQYLKYLIQMAIYKGYGLIYDLATFTYRFTKLVLMYPFFKVYWFGSFQYNKRIRKFFKDET